MNVKVEGGTSNQVVTSHQCLSQLLVPLSLVEGLLNTDFWSHSRNVWFNSLTWGLRIYIYSKFLGETDATDLSMRFENCWSTWNHFLIFLMQNGQKKRIFDIVPPITVLTSLMRSGDPSVWEGGARESTRWLPVTSLFIKSCIQFFKSLFLLI